MSDTSTAKVRRQKSDQGSGRLPIGWSEEKAAIVIDRILDNAFAETAALAAGIPKATYYCWVNEGKRPEAHPRLKLWVRQLENASAQAEAGLLATINFHALKSWQAAAWIAERKWPDRYGRPYRPETKEDPKALPDKELLERLLDGLLNTEDGQAMVRAKLTLIEGGKK